MRYIIRAITLEFFHITIHGQEASFPIETRFCETKKKISYKNITNLRKRINCF